MKLFGGICYQSLPSCQGGSSLHFHQDYRYPNLINYQNQLLLKIFLYAFMLIHSLIILALMKFRFNLIDYTVLLHRATSTLARKL
jgi:hypothetical protein